MPFGADEVFGEPSLDGVRPLRRARRTEVRAQARVAAGDRAARVVRQRLEAGAQTLVGTQDAPHAVPQVVGGERAVHEVGHVLVGAVDVAHRRDRRHLELEVLGDAERLRVVPARVLRRRLVQPLAPVQAEDVLLFLRALDQTNLNVVALVGFEERRERVAVQRRARVVNRPEDVGHVAARARELLVGAGVADAERDRLVAVVDEARAGVVSRDGLGLRDGRRFEDDAAGRPPCGPAG